MEDKKLKYVYLMEEIISKIENNIYKSGDKLDSREKIKEKYNLSDNTVNKALDELANLGYIEKIHRKGTFISNKKDKKNIIAIITPYLYDTTNNSTADTRIYIHTLLLQIVQKRLQDMDYTPKLYMYNINDNQEIEYLTKIQNEDIDGVIYFSSNKHYDILKDYAKKSKPIIFFDTYLSDYNIPIVTSNNKEAVVDTVDILINKYKNEKIICISKAEVVNVLIDRENGYKTGISKNNITGEIIYLPTLSNCSNESISNCANIIHEYSKKYKTAIISFEPGMHKAIWQYFSQNNLPTNNITWGCFDNPYIDYPENTDHIEIIQNIDKMAEISVKKIIELIDNKEVNYIDYIDCTINIDIK